MVEDLSAVPPQCIGCPKLPSSMNAQEALDVAEWFRKSVEADVDTPVRIDAIAKRFLTEAQTQARVYNAKVSKANVPADCAGTWEVSTQGTDVSANPRQYTDTACGQEDTAKLIVIQTTEHLGNDIYDFEFVEKTFRRLPDAVVEVVSVIN